jgi:hypothetical protein
MVTWIWLVVIDQGLANISRKDHVVTILGFVGLIVSVVSTQLWT